MHLRYGSGQCATQQCLEDRADILKLIRREKIDLSTIETAFREARIPEIEDLRIQFEKAKEWIRSSYRA